MLQFPFSLLHVTENLLQLNGILLHVTHVRDVSLLHVLEAASGDVEAELATMNGMYYNTYVRGE